MVSRLGRMDMCFDRLAGGQKRDGLDAGDGASLGKGSRDIGWCNVVGELGYSQNVKSSSGEECGTELAAKAFDGGSNGLKSIFGILKDS